METPHHTTHTQSTHIHSPQQSAPLGNSSHYEWIGREDTREYMCSIWKWKEHTNNERFAQKFDSITTQYREDNDQRTE